MWPTRADGMSCEMPSTIPSPARRIGTSVSFLPATCWPAVFSRGVAISTGSSGRSFVTSYAMSMAISLTSCLKSRVLVRRSSRIVSLCRIRGWLNTVRFGKAGLPMRGKVRMFSGLAKEPPRMKRLALVLLLALVTASATAQAPARKRVAVLDFDYATVHSYVTDIWGSDVDIGKGIADMLVTELVRNGTFSVIERKQLDRVLGEQNFQQSGRADASTAARLGRLLGVDAIIIGSITQFGRDDKKLGVGAGGVRVGGIGLGGIGRRSAKAVVAIDARIVSIETAEILGVAQGKGESKRSGLTLAGGVAG